MGPLRVAMGQGARVLLGSGGECEQVYGFMPCSVNVVGSLFLMAAYGYVLIQGAQLIGDGSEMLLHVMHPGIIGGLVLPILGALPDAIMIVVSGLAVPQDQAQEQLQVGVGTLCGSTIMLLTVAWGGSLLLGRCDFGQRGHAIDGRLKRPKDLFRTGVTCDAVTRNGARIMLLTVLLYLIVQIPASADNVHDPTAALAGAIVCLVSVALYAAYQVLYPELQKKKMKAAHERFMRSHAIAMISQQMGGILDATGSVSRAKCDKLFDQFDADHSGAMDAAELRAMLTGLTIALGDDPSLELHITHWMSEFDTDDGGTVDKDEFFKGLTKWVEEKRVRSTNAGWLERVGTNPLEDADTDEPLVEDQDPEAASGTSGAQEGGEEEEEEFAGWSKMKIAAVAVAKLTLGTLICAAFADPMVGAVSGFSIASGIPKFFISFIVTPMASNSSELLSSFQFARKKRRENISLTFSQVYGAATMNNCLCLGLFLVVVYIQNLAWEYTSETIVTIATTALVGIMAWSRRDFPTYMALIVLFMWPFSVLVVWFLDHVVGLK